MENPPHTPYVNRPTRIIAIVHLSLVFSYLCWMMTGPFVEEHLSFKKRLTIYKTLFGHQDLTLNVPEEDMLPLGLKLQRNTARFNRLEEQQRESLLNEFDALVHQKERTWPERFLFMGRQMVKGIPPYIQAYLLFSLVIAFMLLLRLEGASAAAPLLPLLVLVHIYFSQTQGVSPQSSGEAALFPSEALLVERYVEGELSPNIREQYDQLLAAWDKYLIDEWYPGEPSDEPQQRALELEEAEYRFSLARAEKLRPSPPPSGGERRTVRGNLFFQGIVLFWSCFFAWFVNRKGATDLEVME